MEKQENRLSEMDRRELLDHYQKIKRLALRDSLTGLLNRGALENAINSRLADMEEGECCAFLIIDLDNFKAVNDNLGHQAGDQVLVRTGWILSGMFRTSDVVGRLGGDEFAVFLQGNVTEALARSKGQRICDRVRFTLSENPEISVTASVGIHLSEGGKRDFSVLYQSADRALYKAKKNGKQGYYIKRKTVDQEEENAAAPARINAVRIHSLLDYIDSGVAMIELKDSMKFVYISPSFARMAEEDPEELMKFSAENLIHPEDRQETAALFREQVMEKNETISHVIRIITKKDHLLWWRIHAVRVEYSEDRPAVLVTVTDITEMKERESLLQMDKDLFQMAINQTSQGIWEVEPGSRAFRLLGDNRNYPRELLKSTDFPEELIKNQWIHPESADTFRDFADEIIGGRMQGYGNFKIRYMESGQYTWASLSYRTVYGENGQPLRTVGLIEIMNQGNPDSRYKPKGAVLPESLMGSLVFQVSGNLTQDTVLQCWAEGKDMTEETSFKTCTDILDMEMGNIYLPEKRKQFSRLLSRDSLLLAFLERNKHWMMYEYQRTDRDGIIRWVSCVINLYKDPESSDVYAALWLSRLDKRYQWETIFGIDLYKDPASRLYTRSAIREISARFLEKSTHKLCALVIIEIKGMAKLYSQYTGIRDEKWKAVVYSLLLALGTYCVPAQFAADKYLFFFPEIVSQDALKRKLEQSFLFVRSITSDLVDGSLIRFAAAGVCHIQDETDYDLLLKKVQVLRRYCANASGDKVIFSDEEMDPELLLLGGSEETDHIRLLRDDVKRPLSEQEKTAAFHCILEMLGTNSAEESSGFVLKTLGEFYEADRVYILVTVEAGHIVTMPYEWTSVEKRSIKKAVSGMLAEKLPLLGKCAKEKKPVFLTKRLSAETYGKDQKEEMWNFVIFPMKDENGIQGYLCIENAGTPIYDSALLSLLSSCLLRERKKYLRNILEIASDNGISAFDLFDHNAYMKMIHTFNSDVYTSLGAVWVEIPKFASISRSRGFEYGRKMLWDTIGEAAGIFGRTMVYRIKDTQLAAFCPDTTQQTFCGKCTRLQSALTRKYPGEISVGSVWSDGIFSGKALMDEARLQTRSGRQAMKYDGKTLPSSFDSIILKLKKQNETEAQKFRVMFCCRFDRQTEKPECAEVLIRTVSGEESAQLSEDEVFQPGKISPFRNLDFFVLDYVLKTMNRWKEKGANLIPVLVRFSFETLMDASFFASVLAIFSRYPELDPGLVILGISDSEKTEDEKRLSVLTDQLRSFGVRMYTGTDTKNTYILNEALSENDFLKKYLVTMSVYI